MHLIIENSILISSTTVLSLIVDNIGVIITSLYLILLGFIGHFVIKPFLIKHNISAIKSVFYIFIPIMLIGLVITILIDKNVLLRDTFSRKFVCAAMTTGVFGLLPLITKHDCNLF